MKFPVCLHLDGGETERQGTGGQKGGGKEVRERRGKREVGGEKETETGADTEGDG